MQVKIANLTPQLITASVLDANGELKELKIEGRKASDPVDLDKVSEHTHQLVAMNRLKLRPV